MNTKYLNILNLVNTPQWKEKLANLETCMKLFAAEGITNIEFRLPDNGVEFTQQWLFWLFPYTQVRPVGWTVDLMEALQRLGYEVELVHNYVNHGMQRQFVGSSVRVNDKQNPSGEFAVIESFRITVLDGGQIVLLSASKSPAETDRLFFIHCDGLREVISPAA